MWTSSTAPGHLCTRGFLRSCPWSAGVLLSPACLKVWNCAAGMARKYFSGWPRQFRHWWNCLSALRPNSCVAGWLFPSKNGAPGRNMTMTSRDLCCGKSRHEQWRYEPNHQLVCSWANNAGETTWFNTEDGSEMTPNSWLSLSTTAIPMFMSCTV